MKKKKVRGHFEIERLLAVTRRRSADQCYVYFAFGRRSALEKLPLPTEEEEEAVEPPDSVSVEVVLMWVIFRRNGMESNRK